MDLQSQAAPEEPRKRALDGAAAGLSAWTRRAVRDLFGMLLPALAIAVLLHLFLAQSTIVYGQSMEPNLHNEQRLIVEKITYRFRTPQRGDVVILRDPNSGPIPLIKRVVGLPGERVTVGQGKVYIDGVLLDEPYLTQHTDGPTRSWTVPPLDVFVMGDNRGNSRDSRYFGPVPMDTILGHAVFRYWPLGDVGSPR